MGAASSDKSPGLGGEDNSTLVSMETVMSSDPQDNMLGENFGYIPCEGLELLVGQQELCESPNPSNEDEADILAPITEK